MSSIDDAKMDIENQLRGALASIVPNAAEQAWLSDLAADLAAQKVAYAAAADDQQRAHISEDLDILQATWKLRLAEKELLAAKTAQNVIQTAISTAVTCAFPGGAVASLAKFAITAAANGLNGAG